MSTLTIRLTEAERSVVLAVLDALSIDPTLDHVAPGENVLSHPFVTGYLQDSVPAADRERLLTSAMAKLSGAMTATPRRSARV